MLLSQIVRLTCQMMSQKASKCAVIGLDALLDCRDVLIMKIVLQL